MNVCVYVCVCIYIITTQARFYCPEKKKKKKYLVTDPVKGFEKFFDRNNKIYVSFQYSHF